ncbi:TetR/AcrR family transcriptional regulator [Arthrobacter sp. H14-L1]|uniref:TetR/AcrR family transcriptional regulator n=1 Tax=Arthrobacter sp. H14-L1 TaxID=2996697 RepID=UPI00227039C9|nr:TetR/AcrR family transcriptional regulator [Arthrobacter sp. H14-L1]MCY0905194.1 helix-turn-helix domain containing protein [Arthrobacter sp. H14-L1]
MGAAAARKMGGTRAQIQTVALRLFADHGYEATSMRAIAEQLSITKAALYYHFASKEDIVRALIAAMLVRTAELVQWAEEQEPGPALRREVLSRWADIMQDQGLRMFRFLSANQVAMREITPDKSGMAAQLKRLFAILTPPNASVADQLRARLSLAVINMVGMTASDLDASEDEILAAARLISAELLPKQS